MKGLFRGKGGKEGGRGRENEVVDFESVVEFLRDQAWKVNRADGRGQLVEVRKGAGAFLGPCIDGRMDEQGEIARYPGPKIQGGVYGVMALNHRISDWGRVDEKGVRAACELIRKAGYIPAVHGDKEHGVEGCGFAWLWKDGAFSYLPRLDVGLDRVREIVVNEFDGFYAELVGPHRVEAMDVNLRGDYTFNPRPEGRVALDLWVGPELGIDPMQLISNASSTVEFLRSEQRLFDNPFATVHK